MSVNLCFTHFTDESAGRQICESLDSLSHTDLKDNGGKWLPIDGFCETASELTCTYDALYLADEADNPDHRVYNALMSLCIGFCDKGMQYEDPRYPLADYAEGVYLITSAEAATCRS